MAFKPSITSQKAAQKAAQLACEAAPKGVWLGLLARGYWYATGTLRGLDVVGWFDAGDRPLKCGVGAEAHLVYPCLCSGGGRCGGTCPCRGRTDVADELVREALGSSCCAVAGFERSCVGRRAKATHRGSRA